MLKDTVKHFQTKSIFDLSCHIKMFFVNRAQRVFHFDSNCKKHHKSHTVYVNYDSNPI